MKTLQYKDKTITYDERAPKRWSVQRALAEGETDPAAFYGAIDAIFGGPGKSNEVAEMFDDEAEAVMEILDRVSLAVGGSAKN